jgi:hypothetical protein
LIAIITANLKAAGYSLTTKAAAETDPDEIKSIIIAGLLPVTGEPFLCKSAISIL